MEPEIDEEQATALMISTRADVDRYRDRARSVATLVATATGALTAGLVFTSAGQSFASSTRIAGYVGILLLAVSVCFFLSGSIFRLKSPKGNTAQPPKSATEHLKTTTTGATQAVEKISNRINIGSVLATVGLVSLLSMIPLGSFIPDRPKLVTVHFIGSLPERLPACYIEDSVVRGHISLRDLAGSSALVPISVKAVCDETKSEEDAILYFDRASISLVVIEE